jgi:hypothetical protein
MGLATIWGDFSQTHLVTLITASRRFAYCKNAHPLPFRLSFRKRHPNQVSTLGNGNRARSSRYKHNCFAQEKTLKSVSLFVERSSTTERSRQPKNALITPPPKFGNKFKNS